MKRRTDPRRRFLDEIRRSGVTLSPSLAAALSEVPREAFVPDGFLRRDGSRALPADPDFLAGVYRDDVLVTKMDGSMPTSSSSQPSLMAIMLDALDVRPGHRVLEIGAGTGWNAALLAALGAEVISIEVQRDVADRARSALTRAGIDHVTVLHGDGYAAHAPVRPDRVIGTVAITGISPHWLDADLLVAPVAHAGFHPVLRITPAMRGAAGGGAADGVAGAGRDGGGEGAGGAGCGVGGAGADTGRGADGTGAASASHRAGGAFAGGPGAGRGVGGAGGAGGVDGAVAGGGRSGGGVLRATGRVVTAAGFMVAAGPLAAAHPHSHPAPPDPALLESLAEVAPARLGPPLSPPAYRDLWYAAGVWNRRATHAAVAGQDHACLMLLDESGTGGAVVLPDGSVLAGGAQAAAYRDMALTVLDRWLAAGRPPMGAWEIGLEPAGDPQAPILAPTTWTLDAAGDDS